MAATAGVMPAPEVCELPTLRGRYEQLACVGIRKGRTCPPGRVGVIELLHGCIRTVATGDHIVSLLAKRGLNGGEPVQPLRQLRDVDVRSGKEIDLGRAIRRRDDDLPGDVFEPL